MHVLHAIRWGINAWEQDITPDTIANCWSHSTVLGRKFGPATLADSAKAEHKELYKDIERKIKDLEQAGRIRCPMAIENFISPPDEEVDDNDDDIMEQIVARYGEEDEDGEPEKEDMATRISDADGLKAMLIFQQYEEQQEHGDKGLLEHISRHERVIKAREKQKLKQTTLDAFYI